jgi:hypothetical protein
MFNVSVRVCAICALFCALPENADASATLLADDRAVSFDVSVSDAGGSLHPTDATSAQFGDAFVGAAVSGVISTSASSATASGLSSQTSAFLSDGRVGNGIQFNSFQATGRAIGEAIGQVSGDSAAGFAETFAGFNFSIDTPHQYSITGSLTQDAQSSGASASASSQALVELQSVGRGDAAIDGASGTGPVDLDGTLDPGTYRLIFRGTSEADLLGDGNATSNTSFQNMIFDLTEVPEPATGMMLLTGAMLVMRRGQRRRSEFSRS